MDKKDLDKVIKVTGIMYMCKDDPELTEKLTAIAQKYDFAEEMFHQLEAVSEEGYNNRVVDLFEEIIRGNDYE